MPLTAARVLAGLSLTGCLLVPLLYFWGVMDTDSYKSLLAASSVAWFVFASMVVSKRREEG